MFMGQDYVAGGHKLHFDLGSYNILWWDSNRLDEFSAKLFDKFQKRKPNVEKAIYSSPTRVTEGGLLSLLAEERKRATKWIK